MILTDAIDRIESLEFDVLVNIASDFQTFLLAAQQEEAVQFLYEALEEPENRKRLFERICTLRQRDVDERYLNPGDTALTVYLWGLSLRNWELAKLAAGVILGARQCWWAAKLAHYILLEQPTFSYAGETLSEKKMDQPQETIEINAFEAGETLLPNVFCLSDAGEMFDVQETVSKSGESTVSMKRDGKEIQLVGEAGQL